MEWVSEKRSRRAAIDRTKRFIWRSSPTPSFHSFSNLVKHSNRSRITALKCGKYFVCALRGTNYALHLVELSSHAPVANWMRRKIRFQKLSSRVYTHCGTISDCVLMRRMNNQIPSFIALNFLIHDKEMLHTSFTLNRLPFWFWFGRKESWEEFVTKVLI